MKNFLTLIWFVFIAAKAFGQSKSSDFLLTLEFGPSFMSGSELNIRAKGDSCTLDIRIYKHYNNKEASIESKVIMPRNKLRALTNFLKTYQFKIKGSIDTVGAHKIFEHGDSVLVYELSAGLDGINVSGTLNQNNMVSRFAFWSPYKGTENAKLMAILFNLADNAFTDQRVVNYIEQLEQYFPHQLGLKKLSGNPLTYKLFGSITSDDEDELNNFLKHLSPHRKVIIDISNFSGMGTMFYDVFNQYCATNRNIYWLNPSPQAIADLDKIGIPREQIILSTK